MEGIPNLPPHLQGEFMRNLENIQMKDSLSLDKYESSCVEHCAERYIKMTQRVGLRFAESQALQQKRAAEAAAGGK
ncbi:hypothetical protein HJC23_012158 [Cyclotella cryptica]|uniref:Mitochondrial import inner membrane translocase subunit n=1 Tax=Cyclotella cryptica TaxID=29204 RepID=A0ABD3NHA7_9STRA